MDTQASYATIPTLGDLLASLRQRWWVIALSIAAMLVLAVVYLLTATPYYKSTTAILIDPREKNTVQGDVLPSGLGTTASDNFAFVDSQMKVITSNVVLQPVVKKLKLADDPEFNGEEQGLVSQIVGFVMGLLETPGPSVGSSADQIALLNLRDAIEIKRDPETYVIEITVTSKSPVKSADIAGAIANAYLHDQSEERLETRQRISSQMDAQLATLRDRLLKAEAKAQKFRAEHNLQISENEVLIDTRQLEELNTQLADAKQELAKTQAKYDQLQRLLKSGASADAMADAINSATISQLRDQYASAARREAVLRSELLPSHPLMVQARSDIQRLSGLIRTEVERVAQGIKLENDAAKVRLKSAEEALSTSREEVNTSDSAYIELRELQREAETTRTVYESFLSRVKDLNESENIYTPDARIISPADIPQNPSSPRKFLTLALAGMTGFMLGCGLILLNELKRLPQSPSRSRQVAFAGLPPLVTIPWLPSKRASKRKLRGSSKSTPNLDEAVLEILDGGARSPYRSAIMRLLSYVMDLQAMRQPRVVTLTSALPREGKTSVAFSLGIAAADSGAKTLLVDANSGSPMLTKMLGQNDANLSYRDRLLTDNQLGLSFLSLQGGDPRSAKQIDTAQFLDLAQDFDLTVIDGGILGDRSDLEPLISVSEAVLLVSRASDETSQASAAAASELLDMAHGKYCAAVITAADA